MSEPFHTLGVRTTSDSSAEQRLKVDVGGFSKRKKKRNALRKIVRKVV